MSSPDRAVLQFSPSLGINSVRVHPVVLFNICDCYVRRPDQAERVVGTLLGSVSADGTVDIRNSYAVPHNEISDQVALDIEYHRSMLASHQKVNPKEVIVGWYSTGFGVSGGSSLIHEFYSSEIENPVHLTVDTGFQNGHASIKAYVSINLSLGDRQLAAQFNEIPVELLMAEAERIGFDVLKANSVNKLPTDSEGMESTIVRVQALIDDVYNYVNGVVEGEITADNNIGRSIAEAVASVPLASSADFNRMFNDRLQDNVLLAYLSSLAKTQLSIAEKLNTAAQVL